MLRPRCPRSCTRRDAFARSAVRITTGVKLQGPERSEGLVSFNVRVGQPPRFPWLPALPESASSDSLTVPSDCSRRNRYDPAPRTCTARLAPQQSSTQKGESRSFGSSLGTPQQEPLEHVGNPSRSPFKATLSRAAVVEDARGSPRTGSHSSTRSSGSAATTPSSTQTTGTGDGRRPVRVARVSNLLPHEPAHCQGQSQRRLPAAKPPWPLPSSFSLRRSSATTSRRSNSDARPSESTRCQPPRYNVSSPRRLCRGSHRER
jgi:hypothetical protein